MNQIRTVEKVIDTGLPTLVVMPRDTDLEKLEFNVTRMLKGKAGMIPLDKVLPALEGAILREIRVNLRSDGEVNHFNVTDYRRIEGGIAPIETGQNSYIRSIMPSYFIPPPSS